MTTLRATKVRSRPATSAMSMPPRRRAQVRRALARAPKHLVLIVVGIVWITPALGLLVTSFRTTSDAATSGWWQGILHPAFTLENYAAAANQIDIATVTLNSIAIAAPATVMTTLISAIAAYALARMRFRGRVLLLFAIVGLLITPPQVTLVPMLRLFNALGLSGYSTGVWLFQVGFTVPFGIFLLYGFFRAFPTEMIEAARIDGAGEAGIFTKIVLPTGTPVLAAVAMLQFMWSWNDLLIPLLFLNGSSSAAPFTVQIAGMVQSTGQGQEALAAAAFISVILPVLVLVALQRYFVRGILGGALKG